MPARPNAQRPEREPNHSFFSPFMNNTGGFTVAFGPAVFSTVLGMQGVCILYFQSFRQISH